MEVSKIRKTLEKRFDTQVVTVESHTAGEPTRLIIGGVDPVLGSTMAEKRQYFMENLTHTRLMLTREPRGNRNILAALLTDPTTDGADFGLIYMDACRCPYLCGHATIGAVTTLVQADFVPKTEPITRVLVDTPSGPMQTTAHVQNGGSFQVLKEQINGKQQGQSLEKNSPRQTFEQTW